MITTSTTKTNPEESDPTAEPDGGMEALSRPESLSGDAGLLPDRVIRALVGRSIIQGDAILPDQIQPASLDLRLGRQAHRIRASFIPKAGETVRDKARDLIDHSFDITDGAVLERDCVYLIELNEVLDLPPSIMALANPKSSTGRIDVFTRLIADGAETFDTVPANYDGRLYLEVAPRTFSIIARAGSRLNQIRFFRYNPAQLKWKRFTLSDTRLMQLDEALRGEDGQVGLVDGPATIRSGLQLGVSLKAWDESGIVGYRARRYAPPIDVDRVGGCRVSDYWDTIPETPDRRLVLDPNEFYILASREALHIPPDHAAEMVPIDPAMGEFRVHYAGFFDPGFGHAAAGGSGSRGVLEVRSLDIPFILEHGQAVARLMYEKLAEPSERMYGQDIGSTYQAQGLKLSKHFRSD